MLQEKQTVVFQSLVSKLNDEEFYSIAVCLNCVVVEQLFDSEIEYCIESRLKTVSKELLTFSRPENELIELKI